MLALKVLGENPPLPLTPSGGSRCSWACGHITRISALIPFSMVAFLVHCCIPKPHSGARHFKNSVSTPRRTEGMMQGQTCERMSPAASPKEQEWAGPEPVIRPQAAVRQRSLRNHLPFKNCKTNSPYPTLSRTDQNFPNRKSPHTFLKKDIFCLRKQLGTRNSPRTT